MRELKKKTEFRRRGKSDCCRWKERGKEKMAFPVAETGKKIKGKKTNRGLIREKKSAAWRIKRKYWDGWISQDTTQTAERGKHWGRTRQNVWVGKVE